MNLVAYILSSISLIVFSVGFANSKCSKSLVVQHEPGYIYSPEFPMSYPLNISCNWQLDNYNKNEVTILEYESFSVESPISCHKNKILITHGFQTRMKCGEDRKFFMQIKDENIYITFSTVNNYVDTGFKIKYYRAPIEDTTCSNATVNIKLSRNQSKIVSAPTMVRGLSCRWEVTSENSSDVIVLEVLGANTDASRDWQIQINESMVAPNYKFVELSGLIDSRVRYYRSATNKIVVQLNYAFPYYKGSEEEVIAVSFTSLQNAYFPREKIQVDRVPMYFYIPPYDRYRRLRDQPEIQLSSSGKCIEASLLSSKMSELNIALTEYLYVYEGTSSASALISNVCMIGSNSVRSRLSGMFIQQKQNTDKEGTWLVVKQVDSCDTTEEIILYDPYTIQTLNYPMPIVGDIYCRFKLKRSSRKSNDVISIQAYPAQNKTSTKTCYRGLTFNYDDYPTDLYKYFWWCMDTVEQFFLDKDFVYITLDSRISSVKPFKLVASLVENKYSDNCEKSYFSDFTQPLNIVSPFFEGNYVGPINCTWNVQSKSKYDIMNFTINKLVYQPPNFCGHSILEIQSSTLTSPIKYCSSLSTPVSTLFQDAGITVRFRRHPYAKIGGFNATITAYQPTKPCNGEWIFADTEPQYLVIHDELQNEYGQCNYKITSPDYNMNIVVEPVIYDMGSCGNNRVVFHDGKTPAYDTQIGTLCGSSNSDTRTRYTAESGFMYIVFDASRDAKIKLKYHSEPKKVRFTHLNALPNVQYFTTPSYPRPYEGNWNYTWIIETVKGHRIKLQVLDCNLGFPDSSNRRDTAIVYDGYKKDGTRILGRFYNDEEDVFESSSSSLTVELVSVLKDASYKKGFNIAYSQLELQEASKTSDNSSTVVIVLSCIGVIVFVGLAGIFIYCFTCRRKKPTTTMNESTYSYPPSNHSMAVPSAPITTHLPNNEAVFAPPPPYELDSFIPDAPPPSYEESARYEIKLSTISDARV